MRYSKSLVALSLIGAAMSRSALPAQASYVGLDSSFGNGGIVTTAFGSGMDGRAMLIAPDGKIVVAGTLTNSDGTTDPVVARYNTDGSLDLTFDRDGIRSFSTGANGALYGIALTSAGKYVVVGGTNGNFFAARLNSTGSFDTSFSGDGMLETSFNGDDVANAVAIQSDGRIVAAGSSYNSGTQRSTFAVARYLTNGNLDTSFDGNGDRLVDFANSATPYATVIGKSMLIQSDGAIVVAGTGYNGGYNAAVCRILPTGALDNSFSADGKQFVTGLLYSANAVQIQSDGKLVLAGESGNRFGDKAFVVSRLNNDGSSDTSFGTNGNVNTHLTTGSENDNLNAIILQTTGKIIVSGSFQQISSAPSPSIASLRYNSDGSLDTTFNYYTASGAVLTSDGNNSPIGYASSLQSDGKLVVVGTSGGKIIIVRYTITSNPLPRDPYSAATASSSSDF